MKKEGVISGMRKGHPWGGQNGVGGEKKGSIAKKKETLESLQGSRDPAGGESNPRRGKVYQKFPHDKGRGRRREGGKCRREVTSPAAEGRTNRGKV